MIAKRSPELLIDVPFLNTDRLESDMYNKLSRRFDPEVYEWIHDRMYDLIWDQITEESWRFVIEELAMQRYQMIQ